MFDSRFVVRFVVGIAWMLVAGLANATVLIQYDADTGDPTLAGDIVDPADVAGGSWSAVDGSLGAGDVQQGIIDGGVNAWRNLDGTADNNPGYKKTLSAADFIDMHDNGWQYTVNTRILQNNHFTAWGLTMGTDPGWDLTVRERSGFSLAKSSNAMTVTPLGGRNFNLGVDSADSFHELKNVGAADVSRFRTFIDGEFAGTWDFRDGGSNNKNDNLLKWASGSSGGDNREAYFNEVTLETTTDQPQTELFYDNFQSYTTGQGQISFGPWTATGVTAGRASEVFDAGTGGAAINSRTWVSNNLTTLTADVGLANHYTNYDLSAMLAAGTSGDSATTDFELSLLIGPDVASAMTLTSLSGTAIGGGLNKGVLDRQFFLSHTTDMITPGDHLFLQIEHLDKDYFLTVDDVALWSSSAPVPEPSSFVILSIGLMGLAWRGWRRRRKA